MFKTFILLFLQGGREGGWVSEWVREWESNVSLIIMIIAQVGGNTECPLHWSLFLSLACFLMSSCSHFFWKERWTEVEIKKTKNYSERGHSGNWNFCHWLWELANHQKFKTLNTRQRILESSRKAPQTERKSKWESRTIKLEWLKMLTSNEHDQ